MDKWSYWSDRPPWPIGESSPGASDGLPFALQEWYRAIYNNPSLNPNTYIQELLHTYRLRAAAAGVRLDETDAPLYAYLPSGDFPAGVTEPLSGGIPESEQVLVSLGAAPMPPMIASASNGADSDALAVTLQGLPATMGGSYPQPTLAGPLAFAPLSSGGGGGLLPASGQGFPWLLLAVGAVAVYFLMELQS
jgi:hypothetical protein